MGEAETTARFLETLWGGKDEGGWILIWSAVRKDRKTIESKVPRFTQTAREAAAAVEAIRAEKAPREIWVGVGLREKKLPSPYRGKEADVCAATGLWADLDVAGPAHDKEGLPPDEGACLKILEAAGPAPSMLVRTGHGLQAWWLQKEVLYFDGHEDREAFRQLTHGWHRHLLGIARHLGGWTLDSVGDLARVLRVAGTRNHKVLEEPAAVEVLVWDGPRYGDLEPFREILRKTEIPMSEPPPTPGGPLVLRADAEPPFEKFNALCDFESRFKRSWSHQRKDLDTSLSGYDQSLACHAVMANWSDQEVADLLIAHRRKWDPAGVGKALRKDYIRKTIDRARSGYASGKKEQDVVSVTAVEEEQEDQASDRTGEDLLSGLSTAFGGLPLAKVEKYGRQEASYRLHLKDGTSIEIDSATLKSCSKFGDLVREATQGRYSPPRRKPVAWDAILCKFYQVVSLFPMPELEPAAQVHEWLSSYLYERGNLPEKEEEVETAIRLREPFRQGGVTHVYAPKVFAFLRSTSQGGLSDRAFYQLLRKEGWSSTLVEVPGDQARKRCRYWISPPGWGLERVEPV